MERNPYTEGRAFEMLLRKVFPKRYAETYQSLMRNAISMELGETHAKNLGSTEKQFAEAKELLTKTIDKLCVTPPYNAASGYFESFNMVIPICRSTACLMEVVDKALVKANSMD